VFQPLCIETLCAQRNAVDPSGALLGEPAALDGSGLASIVTSTSAQLPGACVLHRARGQSRWGEEAGRAATHENADDFAAVTSPD